MDKGADVIIVSVYGRGHWLAAELASHGFSVGLVDVTSSMGRWAPEDWEGPFGYYVRLDLTPSQLARLTEDCPQERVTNGFCVWHSQGLIETRGPIASYQFQKSGLRLETQKYLENASRFKDAADLELWRKLRPLKFRETWLAHLAHHLGANVSCESFESLRFGIPIPIYCDHFVRRASRESLKKSLDGCRKLGVQVFADAKVIDVYLEGRKFGGVELAWEKSGIVRGEYLVWMLSSEESQRLPEVVTRLLFPKGFVESQWVWDRYLFNLKTNYFFENLPTQFVWIEDLFLPWSGPNRLIFQKTVSKGLFDIWIQIPSSQRFLKPYLETMGEEILNRMRKRLVGAEISLEKYPQDYYYDYSEMGAAPFVVYAEGALSQLYNSRIKNIFFDGPEHWSNLTFDGQFLHQQLIANEILALRHRQQRKNP